jgi:hypothetical protein
LVESGELCLSVSKKSGLCENCRLLQSFASVGNLKSQPVLNRRFVTANPINHADRFESLNTVDDKLLGDELDSARESIAERELPESWFENACEEP